VARPSRTNAVRMSDSDLSAAIPFVKKPRNLNGELLLDIGFDPLGFTNGVDADQILFFREAEIKHGRVCMLAVTGFIGQEVIAPYQQAPFNEINPINAFAAVPFLGIVQIVVLAGAIELATRNYAGRIPGDIGFDPLGLSKNGIKEDFAIAEIKHGRLAMIAFLAFQVQ
ncbi:chlorophyll a/b-binding protein domain-containing protein, partial [Pavlovales sp. CCMP2436]